MILRILLTVLFLIVASAVLFFIYGIFIPAIKSQTVENQDPLFSKVELNYVASSNSEEIISTEKRAFVIFKEKRDYSKDRLEYDGIHNCALFTSIYDSATEYSYGCIGFGDCVKVCPQEAIRIMDGVAVVTKNCCGCGKCAEICPKNIIKMYDKKDIEEGKTLYTFNSKGEKTEVDLKKDSKVSIPEQKYFKFWKTWYRINHR